MYKTIVTAEVTASSFSEHILKQALWIENRSYFWRGVVSLSVVRVLVKGEVHGGGPGGGDSEKGAQGNFGCNQSCNIFYLYFEHNSIFLYYILYIKWMNEQAYNKTFKYLY